MSGVLTGCGAEGGAEVQSGADARTPPLLVGPQVSLSQGGSFRMGRRRTNPDIVMGLDADGSGEGGCCLGPACSLPLPQEPCCGGWGLEDGVGGVLT